MKRIIPMAFLLAALVLVFNLYSQDATYVGAKKCEMCHKSEKQGEQFPKWESRKHSKSYEVLTTDAAKEIAADAPDNPECLKCHAPLAEKNAVVAAAEKADRMEVAKVMASVSLRIPMKAGKEGHLYGSVGPRQLVDLLEAEGHVVEEKQVVLEQPLKEVGEFDVTISLHPEVQVPIKVVIVNEEE